jgi:hypothetical protein
VLSDAVDLSLTRVNSCCSSGALHTGSRWLLAVIRFLGCLVWNDRLTVGDRAAVSVRWFAEMPESDSRLIDDDASEDGEVAMVDRTLIEAT